jgi:hypothetical protein
MGRFNRVAARSLLVLLSIVITTIGLEAWLALVQINVKSYVRYVPGKETTYLPGAYYRNTKEGFSEGYINSHGFRDYERTYEKPQNTFRIIVLGDSYVEALQVALQDAFPAVLEKMLNQQSNSTRFEVLNLGQSGFGTADEYMRYVNFGSKYSPDLVILAFLTGNDFQDNSKILSGGETRFYFVFDSNGNLVLDRSLFDEYEKHLTFWRKAFQVIKRKSYLASLVSERFYLANLQVRNRYVRKMFASQSQNGSPTGIDEFSPLNIYLPEMSERWKGAFAVTTALVRKFRDTVEASRRRFVLVTLSNAVQVHPLLQQELKREYGDIFDFEQPDRIIGEFARKEHIHHLQLMPTFREYHLRTGKYLHGFGGSRGGHWNENGHRLAAEKLFEFLTRERLVPINNVGHKKDLTH